MASGTAWKWRELGCFLAVSFTVLVPCASRGPLSGESKLGSGGKARRFQIVLTSSRGLELEPCGCTVYPLGGLDREAAFWVKHPTARKLETLYLAVGPSFAAFVGNQDAQVDRIRQETLVEAWNALSLSAASLSYEEVASVGVPRLEELRKKARFPFLSANLQLGEKAAFEPYRIFTVGGVKIGVIGVSSRPKAVPAGYSFLPPLEAMARWFPKIEGTELRIVMGALSNEEREKLWEKFPGLDLMLGARPEEGAGFQIRGARKLLIQSTPQGRMLSLLRFEFPDAPKGFYHSSMNLQAVMVADTWRDQMRAIERRLKREKKSAQRRQLEVEQQRLEGYLRYVDGIPISEDTSLATYELEEIEMSTQWEATETPIGDLLERYRRRLEAKSQP